MRLMMNRAAFHRVSSLQQKCQRGYSCSFNVSTTEEDAERVCDFTALFGAECDWSSFPKRFDTLDLDDSLTRVSSDMRHENIHQTNRNAVSASFSTLSALTGIFFIIAD